MSRGLIALPKAHSTELRSPIMKVYGVSVSYFTGKLEAYLRYKGIAYTMESPFAKARELKPVFGAIQVPMVVHDDGRPISTFPGRNEIDLPKIRHL